METPASHCKEETELLSLLKEAHEILFNALNSLSGTTPPTHESSFLCSAADSACVAADGYILLRENGRVNASKLLIRPMVEAALFATAVVKRKGFYFRKRFSELVEEGKLRGNAPQVKAQVEKASDDLAAFLQKNDPTYPINKTVVTVFEAAHEADLEGVYQVFYRLYCQYTHGNRNAACGQLDGLTDPHDTFLATWCLWQMLVLLPQHTPANIPSLTSLEDRFNRANANMLTASGANGPTK